MSILGVTCEAWQGAAGPLCAKRAPGRADGLAPRSGQAKKVRMAAMFTRGVRLSQAVAAGVEEGREAEQLQGADVRLTHEHRMKSARGAHGGVTQCGEPSRCQPWGHAGQPQLTSRPRAPHHWARACSSSRRSWRWPALRPPVYHRPCQ